MSLTLSSRPERALERSERARGVGRPCVLRVYVKSRTAIASAARMLISALREILDENAYARFLERAKMQSSREAYAAFCREREVMKSHTHRCC